MQPSRLAFPGTISIRECCWACHGTGSVFVSISPLKYRKCGMCMGVGGRGPARRDVSSRASEKAVITRENGK
jgi:DnaJ-class molecular chaperone